MDLGVSCCARGISRENRKSNYTVIVTGAVLVCLLVLSGTKPLLAQSPSFSNFNSPQNLVLNPTAQTVNGVLRLNPSATGQAGSAWFTRLQPVAQGFTTKFTFQITNPSNPSADGIAFVIQNSQAGTSALGVGGGGIGYQGIENSVAIEFDTYANIYDPEWDGSGVAPANHVAIQSCSTNPNSADHTATYISNDVPVSCEVGIATAPVTLADGNPHTVQIEYTPNPPNCGEICSPLMQVTIDGHAVFEADGVPVNIPGLLTLSNPSDGPTPDSAYVGFTGATGDFQEENDILSWTFTPHGSESISQPAPANVFTVYNFGSYLYKVRPDKDIDNLTVTEVPTDPATFAADRGTNHDFPGAQCIIYDSTGNECIEFHAQCTGANCSNVSYDVVTSYDVPSGPPITNPGFLKATGQDCIPGIAFDQNIITEFLQTRTDPTTKGTSKPSFSCFVAVQNVTYAPADLDIVNLGPFKVRTGSNASYIATVTDFGPASGQGVKISNTIPAGTMYVNSALCTLSGGCSPTACSFDGTAASCSVGSLAKFGLEFMVVTVKVTAPAGSKISDTARVSAFNPDPDVRPDRSWTFVTYVTK